ncbi:MAG: hypothetical protein ABIU18_00890, partial [Novosphingobium sp.]
IDLGRSADLARFYTIKWGLVPNSGVDLLMLPLAHVLGLERAGWLVAALIAPLTVCGLFAMNRALGRGIGVGLLLAMAAIWSPPLLLGFVNYALSLALAFLAFALWIRLEGKRWRAPLFLLIAPLLWLCHLSGWGALGVLVFGYEWDRRGGLAGIPGAALATWPLWLPFGLTLATGAGAGGFHYGSGVLIDKTSNWAMALYDQTPGLDFLTVVVLALLPLYAAVKRRLDGRLWRAALIFALLSLVMPRHLGGGDFADFRLVPLALMTGALAVTWEASLPMLALAALPFLLRLGVTTLAWQANSRETAEILGALDHLPQGARIAGAVTGHRSAWKQPAFTHIFAYATVRNNALTNANFAIPGVHMLQLRAEDRDFADPSQQIWLDGSEMPDLSHFPPAAKADWLWYVGEGPPTALPAGAEVIYRTPHSLLARLAKPPASR